MGNLLDHYQATEAARKGAHVDEAEQAKERAVEEAASLERDIDTLANTFGKTCLVELLGPVVHVIDVVDEAKHEVKISVVSNDGFHYEVEAEGEQRSSYSADKFYPFMIDWLKQAR